MNAPATQATTASPPDVHGDATLEAQLLSAVAQGDEAAFAQLRHRYWRSVERVCRSLPGEVEDCIQEVFLRMWRKAHLFDPARGSATAWLLTLARNVTKNLRAGNRPTPVTVEQEAPTTANGDVDRLWLDGALDQLPQSERNVLELAYFADRSQSQIARELGVPLGTVKSWNRRGLNRLAELLAENDR
jgi:RNA polymerase sigma-70 factor (ECF subfamily)